MNDATHITVLKRMLADKQQEAKAAKRQLDQWFGMGVDNYWLTRTRTALQVCRSQADALEWALDKLTRSER